jgi:hypothetical protein
MANEEHLKILKQGVDAWNQWREQNPEVIPDLSGANFSRANLIDVDLRRADLSEADLSEAELKRAKLIDADLSGANLTEAELTAAYLSGTYLIDADLRMANLITADLTAAQLTAAHVSDAYLNWADLSGAYLIGADLSRADFSEAMVGWSTFADIDLSVVKGLDTVRHFGPSTIGIDTIYRSKGKIPEVFLRGAGVPDTFITRMASLVEQASQFYSCFISHSSKDERFCDRLYADLQAQYVQAWYFPKSARWGETVWGEIDRSIERYDKVVVVCSENSLQSGPVLREIERALNRENQEGKSILFPIRIDNYIFDRWKHPRKADVVRKVVGDFRGWNQDAAKYDAAFKKLLRMLDAEGSD